MFNFGISRVLENPANHKVFIGNKRYRHYNWLIIMESGEWIYRD